MANVTYHAALLGLARDLTKRKSPTDTVGVIGTAREASSQAWHVFFLVPTDIGKRRALVADPVAASIVRQLPKVFMERVEAARVAQVAPDNLLAWLSDQLSGSLRIVWTKEKNKQIAGGKQADLLAATVREYGKYLAAPRRKTVAAKSSRAAKSPQYTTVFTPVATRWRHHRDLVCASH